MNAAVDIRAKIYCSLGPAISGSLSDTYAQSAGLIFTRGSVEINAIIRPAVGTAVQFAYLKGSLLTRLPRSVVVLSSFADPFRGKTTVQLGCRLTYLQNRKPIPEEESANSKEENGDVPCKVFEKATLSISASFVLQQIVTALGLQGTFPTLSNTFSQEEFDLSGGYVNVLGDLLVSECYIGYMDASDRFAYKSLLSLPSVGPVIDGNALIDISPIGTGDLPGDSVLVRYESKRLKPPDEEEDDETSAKRSWEWEENFGAEKAVIVTYYDENATEPEEEINITVFWTPYSFSATTYDQWDRAVQRITYEKSILAETNLRYATDLFKDSLGTRPGFLTLPTGRIQRTTWNYKVPPAGGSSNIDIFDTFGSSGILGVKASLKGVVEGDEQTALECLDGKPVTPDDLQEVLAEVNISYTTEAEIAATLGLDTFTYIPGGVGDITFVYDLATLIDIIESATRVEYEKDATSGITKTTTYSTVLYGKTTTGQQDLAKMLQDAQDNEDPNDINFWLPPLLEKAKRPKGAGVDTKIRTEREYGLQKRPSQTERNSSYNGKEDPTEQVSEFVWATNTASENFVEFTPPYSPDDYVSWSEVSGYSVVPSDAKGKALNYGRVQNKILLGNRNGISIQVPAEIMPPHPLDSVYISALSLTGAYLLNGTTFTFDSNGLIGSADCLFWGAVA